MGLKEEGESPPPPAPPVLPCRLCGRLLHLELQERWQLCTKPCVQQGAAVRILSNDAVEDGAILDLTLIGVLSHSSSAITFPTIQGCCFDIQTVFSNTLFERLRLWI